MNRKTLVRILFFVILCVSAVALHAQKHIIDSLRSVVKNQQDDSNKANTLNLLSNKLWRMDFFDSSLVVADSARELSERIEFKKGIANAVRNMATVFWNRGLYPKALDYYLKAIPYDEAIGNKRGIAASYIGAGNVYFYLHDYNKSLDYYQKALVINIANNDKDGLSRNYGNIGNVYHKLGDYTKALEYDFKSLQIKEERGDKNGIAISLGNIGQVYFKQGENEKALEYYKKSLDAARDVGYKTIMALDLDNIAEIYMLQKKYGLVRAYADSAVAFARQINEMEVLKSSYFTLATLDSATGDIKSAYENYKKYIVFRDSLTNEANTKKATQEEMNYQFEEKQATQQAEQKQKDALAEQERKRQAIIRNAFIAGFILMIALAFFIYRGYKQKKEDHILITKQKEEVEQQKAIAEQQKTIVEEKNREILDSITYAKRLQDAILPPLSLIGKHLPDSFVLYKPKDVVSGDFYWMEYVPSQAFRSRRAGEEDKTISLREGVSEGGIVLIAAADCTGHGVPGAMVSVVCSNALNRTVKEFRITETGKILDKVRELVLETFEKSEGEIMDGMDISLCSINTVTNEIEWSGAYNSLWYLHNGQIHEAAPDKQPIGKTDNPKPFSTHKLKVNKGDILYLFTDGYADQFGGAKGKKFKYKQMQEKLLAISQQPMAEQKQTLLNVIEEWQGNLEQTDDICVIGIKV